MPPQSAPLPAGVKFLPSGVKFLPGPGVQGDTAVSPPKPSSAPPGAQTVDSSPMGSLPVTLAPKGKLALPPNPITQSLLTGPKPVSPLMVGRPGHQHPAGAMDQFQHEAEAAAAPAVADYNRRSGGTQGIVPGMKPEDLAQIRESASRNPGVAAAMGSITNPEAWVAGAVHGAKDVAAGVGKAVHGNLSGGSEQAGLGALGVAGILPIGKVGKIGELAGEALLRRTPEEAAQHVFDAATAAKAEGFGHVPLTVPKGVATPETGGELGRQIRESFQDAPEIRKAQKAGYSTERVARLKVAVQAGIEAGGGTAGHIAAKAHLAGALPREHFGALQHFTPEQVDQVHHMIDEAPIMDFQKIHARDAITNAAHGVVPTEGDQQILERVFGKVASTGEDQVKLASFWDKFVSYTNIPRALRSSADVSAAMRQGLVVLVTHPKVWGRQFAKSIKSFGSEDFYQAQQEAIHSDPLYPLFLKWKVPFTEIGGKVSSNEEAFIGGQAAEHLHELPGIKGTPVATLLRPASNVIRRSDRAFTGFQNGARFEMASMLAEKAAILGHDLNGPKLGPSIAKVVGTFTGRGVTPKILAGHLTTMNALMFSPRLMAARLNLLSPVYYAKLDPFARAEALRGARNLVASIGTVMFVAKMLGAEVNFDPRSSNFTKIKIGNTRIDIAGGFSQYVRFIAQEMTREAISSSGHKSHIGWGPKDISDLANLTKLGRSKSAPIPGLLWDEGSGKDFIGQPVKQGHELFSNAPFVVQDTRDALKQSGSKAAVIDGFLSAIGLGVQSYKDKKPASSGSTTPSYGDSGGSYGDSGSGGYGDTSGSSYGGG